MAVRNSPTSDAGGQRHSPQQVRPFMRLSQQIPTKSQRFRDRRLIQFLLGITVLFGLNLCQLVRHFRLVAELNYLDHDIDHPDMSFPLSTKVRIPDRSYHDIHPLSLLSDEYESIFCVNNRTRERYTTRTTSYNNHPIFLWGIPSTVSDYETGRRALLRQSYLNFYHLMDNTLSDEIKNSTLYQQRKYHKDRICSLQEWTCQYEKLRDNCQLIYVFFIGSNPKAPPEWLDESLTDFRTMLFKGNRVPKLKQKEEAIDTSSNKTLGTSSNLSPTDNVIIDKREPGVVYLNIRENQFDGKMPTWFQFAALVGQEYPEIDYAAKVDSDLLLLTPNFLAYMEEVYPTNKMSSTSSSVTRTVQTYGGVEFPATNCVINHTFDHPCPLPLVGPSYMSGELNFMSMDLATYIVSNDCPRAALTIPHEDVSLSNYVYSYTNNTAYHTKHQSQYLASSHDIHVISFNTSRILLTGSMTADWATINIRTNPEQLSTILWGHSIKRGNYKQYLIFKNDKTFRIFWERFKRVHISQWQERVIGNSYNLTTTGTTTSRTDSVTGNSSSSTATARDNKIVAIPKHINHYVQGLLQRREESLRNQNRQQQ